MAMHNRKNYIIDLTQLIAWVGLLLMPSLVDLTITGHLASSLNVLKGTFLVVLPYFCIYALNYYLFVPAFLHVEGKKKWFYICNALILIAWDLIRILPRKVEFPPETVEQFGERGMMAFYVGGILVSVLIQLLVIALAAGLRHIMRTNEQMREAEEERRKTAEAELTWLKNQLNPHFLFNTLNNISSLTQIDPEQAQERIGQLSEALRYALYDSNAASVPLSGEVAFMENYIDLMALRCNERTTVERTFVLPDAEVQVAPLLFISLIENAFKHGVSARVESFVRIGLRPEGRDLCFTCENSFVEKTGEDRSGSGIGLANMQRRLELIYPGHYCYEHSADGGVYRAVVRLKDIL